MTIDIVGQCTSSSNARFVTYELDINKNKITGVCLVKRTAKIALDTTLKHIMTNSSAQGITMLWLFPVGRYFFETHPHHSVSDAITLYHACYYMVLGPTCCQRTFDFLGYFKPCSFDFFGYSSRWGPPKGCKMDFKSTYFSIWWNFTTK